MKELIRSVRAIRVAALVLVTTTWPMQFLYGQVTATANQGITGSVTDPSGAAIPGAQVVVRNTATGIEFTTTTGVTGYFSFPGLLIGPYRVTASKAGFETDVREDVTILAGRTPNVDFQLKVGSTSQTVEVRGEAGTVDKTTAVMDETIPKEALQDLPIIASGGTRSPLDYLATFGGVSQNTYNEGARGGDVGFQWSQIDGVGDGGGFLTMVSYKVDGVDQATDQTQPFGGIFAVPIMPAPSAIQEARLLTDLDADQGFNLGAVYELITKSGTSRYHGEAYEYARNDALDARNFLSANVPPEKQHDFGVTFGGPIPKTNKKHFFFVNYQGFRSAFSSVSSILTVPTALERAGNFSQILGPDIGKDNAGNPVFQGEVFNPNSSVPDGHGGFERMPISGTFANPTNMIPSGMLSKVSQFFQNSYPLPNLPGTTNNYEASALPDNTVQDKLYIKTDHNINERQRVSVGFNYTFRNGTAGSCGNVLPGAANYLGFGNDINGCSTSKVPYKAARLNYTFSIRPDLLLALNMGWAWDPYGDSLASAGLTAGARSGLKQAFTTGTPVVNIADSTGFLQTQNRYAGEEYIVPVDLSMTWVKGSHQLKFGSQFNQVIDNPVAETNSNGTYSFDGGGTNQPDYTLGTAAIHPGYGWADYLLGWVDSGSVASPFAIHTVSHEWAWFAEDVWRATPKLTLTYGLRWELYMPAHETYNRWSNFCPSCQNPGAGNIPGALVFLGSGPGRIGRNTEMNTYPWAVAPRLGIAYAFTRSTVLRLYGGIFRFPVDQMQVNGVNFMNNGFGVNINDSTTNGGITPVIANWDTTGFTIPPFPSLVPTFSNGTSVTYYDYNDNRAHPSMDAGAGIEHQFSSGFLLSAKYAGKFMHGLPTNNLVTLNQLPLADLSLGLLLNDDINSAAARAANIPIPYPGFTGTVAQALRPYPQYQTVNENDALAKNIYWNAVVFGAQQRYHNGLTLLANWTLSKEITNDVNTWCGGCTIAGYANSVQHTSLRGTTPLLPIESFEDVGGDRPSVLNIIFNYQLPFGHGMHFGSNVNRGIDAGLGGWNLAGILEYASGTPEILHTSGGGGPTITAWAVRTSAPVDGNASCGGYDPGNPESNYLNPAAYANPPAFQLGSSLEAGRRGCGVATENLALSKSFKLPGEGRSFKIGADSNNVFNRHSWYGLGTSVGSTSFGRFGGVTVGRAVQVHAQIFF